MRAHACSEKDMNITGGWVILSENIEHRKEEQDRFFREAEVLRSDMGSDNMNLCIRALGRTTPRTLGVTPCFLR